MEVSPLFSLIGNTAIVEIRNILPPEVCSRKVRIFAKMENRNLGGSVKDRAALSMIRGAEERKKISPGMLLIEPTSGNTGISLAMVAAVRGYPIELVMPENASVERRKVMQAYGAKVTLTPASKEMEGAIDYVNDKLEKHANLYMLNQFANEDNPLAHYQTTAPEIWQATAGEITHFVSAMGTTGTIMGVGRFLKEKKSSIRIIGARPKQGSSIPGIRRWPKAYLPKIFRADQVDEIIDVSAAEASSMARLLAKKEGILCGMSSGGACHIALNLAKRLHHSIIVFIICDGGDRYLSTDLFSL